MTRSLVALGILWMKTSIDSEVLVHFGAYWFTHFLYNIPREKSLGAWGLENVETIQVASLGYDSSIEHLFKLPYGVISRVRCRTVMLKPLRFNMQISLTLQESIKGVQYPSISFLCNCNSNAMLFNPQWTNYLVCTDSAPCCTFISTVKWTLIDFIRRFTTPWSAVLWSDVSIQLKVGFVIGPNVLNSFVFSIHFFLKT